MRTNTLNALWPSGQAVVVAQLARLSKVHLPECTEFMLKVVAMCVHTH